STSRIGPNHFTGIEDDGLAPDRIDRNRVRRRLPQGSSLEVLEADLDADGFARRRQVRQPDGDEQVVRRGRTADGLAWPDDVLAHGETAAAQVVDQIGSGGDADLSSRHD